MTIRWFTDADRQKMRDAKEKQQFLQQLYLAERPESSPAAMPVTEAQLRLMSQPLDPRRRLKE
ncbi:hypothetical protein [Blastococcus sp. TF02A-26]|uniref:hypothetical protein n=1 Tax=Blastococcus sp. TF02A-26 TaxID=2250577 RepID=UPI000DEA6116|nr:hypothetical protein [Blastococcus sp. TF02A-26]RBY90609.1 hypothetical protein DQ240_00560 [Blastococcus sp. TF02A-26]